MSIVRIGPTREWPTPMQDAPVAELRQRIQEPWTLPMRPAQLNAWIWASASLIILIGVGVGYVLR